MILFCNNVNKLECIKWMMYVYIFKDSVNIGNINWFSIMLFIFIKFVIINNKIILIKNVGKLINSVEIILIILLDNLWNCLVVIMLSGIDMYNDIINVEKDMSSVMGV